MELGEFMMDDDLVAMVHGQAPFSADLGSNHPN
jgi:hypothetical protein